MKNAAFQPHLPDLKAPTKDQFAELSTVALARAMTIDGRVLPKETRGTVVAAYTGGLGRSNSKCHFTLWQHLMRPTCARESLVRYRVPPRSLPQKWITRP